MIGLVRFFIRTKVPGKLLTIAIIVAGIISALTIRREFFPDIETDAVRIVLMYPGATPQEIEDSLARRVEDVAIEIDGVDRIETTISEGGGGIIVKFDDGSDMRKKIDDLRDRVEALTDLPAESERIHVVELEATIPVIQVTVSGDGNSQILKDAIRQVADDLRTFSGMGQVVISGTRDEELRIEVNHGDLLRHGIPITRVADAVSAWMRDIPGGTVRSVDGETKVRTLGVDHRADQIRSIVIKAFPDGGLIRVGDIAVVEEGFVDDLVVRTFNGRPAANCTVFRMTGQDAIDIAMFTRGYVAARRGEPLEPSTLERFVGGARVEGWTLGNSRGPMAVAIQKHNDLAMLIEGRLDLLISNAIQGGLLVFVALLLGVHWRAACFVTLGIVVAVFGTIWAMDASGISLNMLTMFALLLSIGIQADDAIVFSESVECETADPSVGVEDGVVRGVQKIVWPVVASAATTIVAFLPLGLVKGSVGDLLGNLPIVVTLALTISLFEATLLMPGHMAGAITRERTGRRGIIDRLMGPVDRWRERLLWPTIERCYRRAVLWCVDRRYMTVAAGFSAFILSVGMIVGGRLPFTFLPSDDSETFVVDIRLPLGSSLDATRALGAKVEEVARGQAETQAVTSLYGVSVNLDTALADRSSSNLAQIFVELAPVETRDRRSSEVIDSIVKVAQLLDGAESIRVREFTGGPTGSDITYELSGSDLVQLRAAAESIKTMLAGVQGVMNVSDDDFDAAPEVQVVVHPAAAALGFTPTDVARQVRGALFGLDAHVFSANREEVDVRVRLDDKSRANSDVADRMWVVSPTGATVPLGEIAQIHERASSSMIRRLDRERTITVTADTEESTRPESVVEKVTPAVEELMQANPDVRIRVGGRQQDLNDAFATLPLAMVAALLMIYGILAWLFDSMTQPLAVMVSIPFGVIGMVVGHMIMGYDLTFLSLIGLIALAGVVVNNALVLVEFINMEVDAGRPLREALAIAGQKRIRAILLTSITGVLGLAPLVLAQSFQARFLVPMALTLSAGLVSATVLTLILLPSFIHIIEDTKRMVGRVWNGPPDIGAV